jgi:hypothetical protein
VAILPIDNWQRHAITRRRFAICRMPAMHASAKMFDSALKESDPYALNLWTQGRN